MVTVLRFIKSVVNGNSHLFTGTITTGSTIQNIAVRKFTHTLVDSFDFFRRRIFNCSCKNSTVIYISSLIKVFVPICLKLFIELFGRTILYSCSIVFFAVASASVFDIAFHFVERHFAGTCSRTAVTTLPAAKTVNELVYRLDFLVKRAFKMNKIFYYLRQTFDFAGNFRNAGNKTFCSLHKTTRR